MLIIVPFYDQNVNLKKENDWTNKQQQEKLHLNANDTIYQEQQFPQFFLQTSPLSVVKFFPAFRSFSVS